MQAERPYPGYLIAFEGPEGIGRGEAIEQVRSALRSGDLQVAVTRPLRGTLAGGVYQQARLFNELSPRTLVLLAASDLAERLEFVFHFVQPPERLAKNLDLSTLDLYEAGMDIGVTRDIPLSYQLYQERLLHEYQLWAAEHGLTLIRNTEVRHILERVERLLDLDPIRPDRRRAVLELMRDRGADREHALHTAASRQGPPPAARALGPALNRAAGDRCG